ncbi:MULTISPECIES: ribbon-helix-helix domain-containing protein [unclassified Sphingomonas]|jgi:antitoxin ParD1/3/4|uniref:ribbon-helix-helix domain-containing protein n=1 Tax=unclassified Sphingomonas TaxID=196159 RepID=UPI000A7A6D9D|nr:MULTISPECIES: type II toxin-antitoxin system ParD family antitoxin [unclassified Sphingomonas]
MTDLTLSLPPALQSWINARVADGLYLDAADYLRDLVRRDQESADADTRWVRAMIEEGLASGIVDQDPRDIVRELIDQDPDLRD